MHIRLLLLLPAISCQIAFSEEAKLEKEPLGIVGTAKIDGKRVVYRFVTRGPTDEQRKNLPWCAVVSWKYDGTENEGMPAKAVQERMRVLDDSLEKGVVKEGSCEHLISRTGNNLKELIYYIRDRDAFIEQLNNALADHEAFPIEIEFFADPEWKELMDLRADFKTRDGGDAAKDPVQPQAEDGEAKDAPSAEQEPSKD